MADKNKKTLYHSEAVSLSPLQCSVESDAIESRYKPGTFFVMLKIGNEDRTYNCENAACKAAFKGTKNRRVMLQFAGRSDDATVTVLGAGQAAAPQPQETLPPSQQQEPPPGFGESAPQRERTDSPRRVLTPQEQAAEDLKEARRRQIQVINLWEWNIEAAVWLADKYNKNHPTKKPMDTEDIRCVANSLQIACEHQHVVQIMPAVMWDKLATKKP